MIANTLNGFIQCLRRGGLLLGEAGLTDGELLEAYIARRDQAAFETLVRRHGPMVLGVCRRILRNDADAEDAFQATFLVLVRKASTIRAKTMVSNWLYGVAHNTALKAKAMNRRRQTKEREAATLSKGQANEEVWRQAQALLDEAMSGLSDKYRVAIVLCDLEGRTIKEAARQLGCPTGTVATRLARGRTLLAKRLSRHGLTLSGGAVAAVLSEGAASAGVSASLIRSTIQAATTTGNVSARVAALTEGVVAAMFLNKLKIASATLVALGMFTVAAGLFTLPMMAAQQPAPVGQAEVSAKKKAHNQPKADEKAKAWEIAVIVKAQLYEVDDAFYEKLAKEKRLSMEDLEELQRHFLAPPKQKQPEAVSSFKFLEKQKLLLDPKEMKLEIGKEGTLVSLNKQTNCLPSPDQLRKGDKSPQTIQEGVTLLAQLRLSADRRFVRAKFTEKSVELEGIDKVKVLDDAGNEAMAEIPFLKESRHHKCAIFLTAAASSCLFNIGLAPPGTRLARWL
jgi:RNA polymerase sigma factor (sigma-70 family)